jgi:integrase
VEDWLHGTFDAWWTMYSVRAIMSRLYYYAEGYGLWEEGRRSPASRAKLGKKRYKYERRILSFEETARVLARLDELTCLVIEMCIATGARISEVLGLQWRHVNLDAATVKIEQRVWHQEVGRPKTEESRRVLGIGDLAQQLRARALKIGAKPDMWVFPQKCCAEKPMWDSTVRELLHEAAKAEGCNFLGLGPHSFRRANITWRQEVGGSAIEASRIAGHTNLDTTSQYTFVAAERQNELTRRIQKKLADAGKNPEEQQAAPEIPPSAAPPAPEVPRSLADAVPVTAVVH